MRTLTPKTLHLKRKGQGLYEGRPYWNVTATIMRSVDQIQKGIYPWKLTITEQTDTETVRDDSSPRISSTPGIYERSTKIVTTHHADSLKECLRLLDQYGDKKVLTTNILNPKAGSFPIKLRDKGGCCDPGTERYHCM